MSAEAAGAGAYDVVVPGARRTAPSGWPEASDTLASF